MTEGMSEEPGHPGVYLITGSTGIAAAADGKLAVQAGYCLFTAARRKIANACLTNYVAWVVNVFLAAKVD